MIPVPLMSSMCGSDTTGEEKMVLIGGTSGCCCCGLCRLNLLRETRGQLKLPMRQFPSSPKESTNEYVNICDQTLA
jgi:hypothetical protein